MPKKYEAIRDHMLEKGLPPREAKKRAAMIYNAGRKPGQRPVTNKPHGRKK